MALALAIISLGVPLPIKAAFENDDRYWLYYPGPGTMLEL